MGTEKGAAPGLDQAIAAALDYLALGHWHSFQQGKAGKVQPRVRVGGAVFPDERVRTSEEHFRSIFNNSPIAIGIGRRDDGRLVEVNDAWLQLYGFERDEVIGRTAIELNLYASPDDRSEIIRLISACGQVVNRATGKPFKPRQYFNASPESQAVPKVSF